MRMRCFVVPASSFKLLQVTSWHQALILFYFFLQVAGVHYMALGVKHGMALLQESGRAVELNRTGQYHCECHQHALGHAPQGRCAPNWHQLLIRVRISFQIRSVIALKATKTPTSLPTRVDLLGLGAVDTALCISVVNQPKVPDAHTRALIPDVFAGDLDSQKMV